MWTDAGQKNFISIQMLELLTKNDPLHLKKQKDNAFYSLKNSSKI